MILLNREQFTGIMSDVVDHVRKEDEWCDAYNQLVGDNTALRPSGKLLDITLDLLAVAMEDVLSEWIVYFAYERDFGREGYVSAWVNNKEYPFSTIDDLYTVLMAQHQPAPKKKKAKKNKKIKK